MKTQKIKNQFALKRGTYNTVLIAIVLMVIITLNVLFTMLAQRYPLQIDITATGENTLSEDNIDFIKEVDRDIEIVLCANETSYASDMQNYAYNLYGVIPDNQTASYYTQACTLLESYSKYNDRINFRYVTPDSSVGVALKEKYFADTTINYGDILVYSTVEDELGERTNTKVINYTEMYVFNNESGYYVVSSSDIESAVTGGIATVLIDDIKNVAYYPNHSTEGMFDYLKASLSNNGFKVNEVSDTVIKEIPEDTDIVVLAGPEKDLTADELRVLDEFLDNDGKKGKNLFVFFGMKADTPNLDEFLAEWGVQKDADSVVFETDPENCVYESGYSFYSAPYVMNMGTEYTKDMNSANNSYVSMYNVPLKAAYQTFGNRTTYVLMSTSDTAVAIEWTEEPDDVEEPDSKYTKDSFATAILTSDIAYTEDGDANVSNVITFSSANFISGEWDAYYGCSNLNLTTTLFKSVTNQESSEIFYSPKTVSTYQFISMPTKSETDAVMYIFIVAVPVLVLGGGIVIWLRRKSR